MFVMAVDSILFLCSVAHSRVGKLVLYFFHIEIFEEKLQGTEVSCKIISRSEMICFIPISNGAFTSHLVYAHHTTMK